MPDLAIVENFAHLPPIHSEADYDRMVALMNALLDVTGDDEDHPLSSLLELAADPVSRYLQEHHPIAGKLGTLFGISPAVFVPR